MENSILKKDIIKSGVIESLNERFGQWKQAVKNRDKAHKKPNRKAPKQGSIKSRVKKGVGRVPLKDVNTPEKKNSIQRVGGSRGVHTANRKSKAAQGKQAPVIYSYKKKVSEDVSDIIKQGVSSYLNQNKNISVKDLLTKKSRERAGNQLKSTLKTTALDTGQNVINSLRQEEVSRRKKPSAIKKKAKLNAALEKLKNARSSVQEDIARFDKLVKTIKSTPDLSKEKTARLLRIAGKVRSIKETRVMNSSSIEKSGPTIDVTATEVKDKKKGENAQKRSSALAKRDDKGSTLANRGTKNTEVKPERKPKPYSKKKNKFKGPSKDDINKTVSKVGSAAKSGISAFTSGYDAKEEKSFSQYTEAAIAIPAIKYGVPAAVTAVGAIGTYLQSRKKSPGQGNLFPKGSTGNPYSQTPRAKSSRAKSNRKSGDEAEARANSLRGSYDKSVEPVDNPEAREGIRNILDKLNKKNNKLYKDYNNPKP